MPSISNNGEPSAYFTIESHKKEVIAFSTLDNKCKGSVKCSDVLASRRGTYHPHFYSIHHLNHFCSILIHSSRKLIHIPSCILWGRSGKTKVNIVMTQVVVKGVLFNCVELIKPQKRLDTVLGNHILFLLRSMKSDHNKFQHTRLVTKPADFTQTVEMIWNSWFSSSNSLIHPKLTSKLPCKFHIYSSKQWRVDL